MLIELQAQRFVQRLSGLITTTATSLGSMRVAQSEADGDEHTRAGMRFHMSGTGATGIAPVQALPSTAAQWLIYNPLSNPVSALVDRVGMFLVSGTAGAGGTVLGCIVPPSFAPATVPTVSAANVKISNANPVSTKASSLIVASGQTLQNAATGNWFPLCQMNPAGTLLGQTYMDTWVDLRGRMMIPPGCGLALVVISPTGTTPLFAPFAAWREFSADLE
jgi:hypothetical protein